MNVRECTSVFLSFFFFSRVMRADSRRSPPLVHLLWQGHSCLSFGEKKRSTSPPLITHFFTFSPVPHTHTHTYKTREPSCHKRSTISKPLSHLAQFSVKNLGASCLTETASACFSSILQQREGKARKTLIPIVLSGGSEALVSIVLNHWTDGK